ncbi:MAG: hypothetical protein E7012_06555 [Alphaproteobacteria bacterium]|nr:hypothetical protein [Alphaproteobacteria bacterium]
MNKYVISVSILLLSSSSLAQDSCMVRPSCADMGYTKSATDCEGKKAIACPFDLSAYYCPEVGESCDFSEYPLTECPNGGNCTEFECGETTQYKLDSCQNNYEISTDGTTCNACNFTNYPLASCPSNGNCSNYSCGGTTKYKLNSCNSGYTKNGNTCTACNWGDYTLTSCPTGGNCSNLSCGGTTKYKLNSCQSGYTINSAKTKCTACSWGDYTASYCPYSGTCSSKTCGGKTQYKVTSCDDGYYLSNNDCRVCSCYNESNCIETGEGTYLDLWHEECGCYQACCNAGGCAW